MASAKNCVLSGDYKGAYCGLDWVASSPHVYISSNGNIPLTKTTVSNYCVVDEEQHKSATSGILRAGAGALLLGPIGLAAGLSAKSKGIYTVAIEFKDGKKSLIEIDNKLYKQLIRDMF